MRYEKDERLLKLVWFLQSDSSGRCIADIEEEFSIGRRTAERLRASVERLFPGLVEVDSFDNRKRWRLPSSSASRALVSLTADELSSLELSIEMMKSSGLHEHEANITGVVQKLKSMMHAQQLSRVETDLEALTEAEGLAQRPGPRLKQNSAVTEVLRDAMLALRRVEILVTFRSSGKTGRQTVEPYGFLYGTRNYLVANVDNPNGTGLRLFSLSNISSVRLLEDGFSKDSEFSLQEYAERSFGVFQEEPVDVCWKFSKKVADDAKEYLFHPTQTVEEMSDGSLVVKFRAGGRKEMDWHLYTWGDEVEVLEGPINFLCKNL